MIKLWLLSVIIHIYASYKIMRFGEKIYRKDVQSMYSLHDIVHSKFNIPSAFFRIFLEFGHAIPALHLFAIIDSKTLNLWLLRHSALLLCRVLCFSSTLLPLTNTNHDSKPLWFLLGGKHDLLFSGHASFMWLSTLMLKDLNINTNLYITYVLLSILVSFGIVVSRNHYTIDVLVAILATSATMHLKID